MEIKERINIMIENDWVVDHEQVFKDATYVFVVRRKGVQASEDAWHGKLAKM